MVYNASKEPTWVALVLILLLIIVIMQPRNAAPNYSAMMGFMFGALMMVGSKYSEGCESCDNGSKEANPLPVEPLYSRPVKKDGLTNGHKPPVPLTSRNRLDPYRGRTPSRSRSAGRDRYAGHDGYTPPGRSGQTERNYPGAIKHEEDMCYDTFYDDIPRPREFEHHYVDADEHNVYHARFRNEPTRVVNGTMDRINMMDRYVRDDLDLAESSPWWGRHEV